MKTELKSITTVIVIITILIVTGCEISETEMPCTLGWQNETHFCNEYHWIERKPVEVNESDFGIHNIGGKRICFWNITSEGWLPDPSCSPGGVNTECTVQDICTPGYTKTVRNVSQSKKELVYNNYGVLTRVTGEYEMDHIVPLELCGSNDITNLYPQPAEPILGFKQKDRLENIANDLVCAGEETLEDAQRKIATDWIAYYHEVIE